MLKLLFICKDRHNYDYGNFTDHGKDKGYGSYGLINSCKLIKECLETLYPGKIECNVVTVVDNNKIDREVYLYKPTHVFIEALWVVPKKFYELIPRYPGVEWSVRIHSKTPFLSNEGVAFDWINDYLKICKQYPNFHIAANDLEFTEDMEGTYNQDFLYLPNLYWGDWKFRLPKKTNDKGHIDVGCFGAIRPMKNQLQQAIAAVMLANELKKKLKFHMNGRAEQKGEQVLRNIQALMDGSGHELVLHGWHPHKDFLKLVKTMDVGLQVSFSESFNIVAADFIIQDVPIVVSEDIRWASHLYMAETTSAENIKEHMASALRWRSVNLQYLNKLGLKNYNKGAIEAWVKYLLCE